MFADTDRLVSAHDGETRSASCIYSGTPNRTQRINNRLTPRDGTIDALDFPIALVVGISMFLVFSKTRKRPVRRDGGVQRLDIHAR